nr:putative ribonuclease H-like domain-containing protein [Tanacetum cinerariifolium]
MTLPNPQQHVVSTTVLTKSKLVLITFARQVTTAVTPTNVTRPRPAKTVVTKPHSPPRRNINRSPSPKASTFPPKVNDAEAPIVNAVKGVQGNWGNPQQALKDKKVIDSGCLRHMTEINGGYVSFGGNLKGGKISGKDTGCIVLSPEFKLPDENQVLLRVHRKNNMYNVDLKNIIPSGDLTCLFAKATLDESNLWHRRLGHINFKTMSKLVKDLEDITYSDDEEDVGVEADFTNLETNITVSPIPTTRVHKDHHEEGIDYEEVFAPVARIEAIRLFLAYASFMGFMVYQMDVKSAFMYGTIKEEVYVCQPSGFEDPDYLDKVYKVVKALYGLHQAPRAWYETLANYLLKNGFQIGKIDQTLFIKRQKGDILLVQIYVDDIIFGSTNKDLCKAFEKLMKDKFQMSSMGELSFFLGLQVKQKPNGIFISRDKYVAKIVRKFGLTDGKSTSTPIDTEKPLLKDLNGGEVDVHTYRSMIGSLMYLTSSRPDIMFAGKPHLGLWYPKDSPFNLVAYSDSDYAGASLERKSTTEGCQFLGCRLNSWQCKKQTVVATSSTEAEYVAAASCCAQVLWIQNQLLDYGLIVTAVSSKFLMFSLTKIDAARLMLLGHKVNDVTRLQALVDRKKVIIAEATIREALRLDDAESIDCLPNDEIFTELSRTGYEKPSTKLTFYKAFFSPQWKFLIHNILQCMSAKRISWNEFSSSMDSAVICLSIGRKFNFSKYIFNSLVRNVYSSTKFYMYPRFLQLMIRVQVSDISSHSTKYSSSTLTQKVFANMRRVGKGFSGVDTPLFEGMIVAQQANDVADEGAADVDVGTAQRVDTSEDTVMDDVSKQGEIIANIDTDEDVTLKDVAKEVAIEKDVEIEENAEVLSMHDDKLEPSKLKEVVKVVTSAKLMTEVVTVAAATITAADTSITVATIITAPNKRKEIMVKEPKPLKKQAQTEQDEAYVRELEVELNKTINWDDVIDQVQRKEKEDNVVMRYQTLKRKPQTEAQARKNMMIYLRNMAVFKMDYFKGMSYDDIRPIFKKYFNSNVAFLKKTKEQMEEEDSRALKRASESQAEKAAKKQKLDEEVEELKKHLQIVRNDEDDVYTEATPLACKVPVVDYEIYTKNNKPYYKIIRADGSPQLFLSFLSLLRNFDREDLEVLWQLVKETFASLKPKNFSDDFLLTTLTYMFEKPNVQAQVWKNQRSIHGLAKVKSLRLLESYGVHIITFTTQMILLVERRYPLTMFTLDQMLNNVRLEVKEESEVSLELLRFMRPQ